MDKKDKNNINRQNNKLETPILIACKNSNETLYRLYEHHGGDPIIMDNHNNTCYHYICLNKMFIGSKIINTKNKYNLTPFDYSPIDIKLYKQ